MRDVRVALLAVPVVAGAVTVVAALCPGASFASRVPSLLVVTATAPPTLAVVAGLMLLGRLRRGARLNELTLVCALGTLALSGLAFVTILLFLQRFWPDLSVWAALAGSAIGAAVLTAAAHLNYFLRPALYLHFLLSVTCSCCASTPSSLADRRGRACLTGVRCRRRPC